MIKRLVGIWSFLLFVVLPFAVFAQDGGQVALTFTTNDAHYAYCEACALVADCTPRDAGTLRGRLAANWILDHVSRTGVDASIDAFLAETPKGERRFANVIVEFPVQSPDASWVVLLSHFDTAPNIAPDFEGANDGASTTGLLIALADVIRRAGPLADNVALVWTDAEEALVTYADNDGFQGAKHIVSTYQMQGRKVKAVIGLDMLGDKDLHITLPVNGHPTLNKIACIAAARAGLGSYVTRGQDVVRDDFAIFQDAGFAAIDLIDFTYGPNNSWWHTQEDRRDKISERSLLIAGKVTVAILNVLENHSRQR